MKHIFTSLTCFIFLLNFSLHFPSLTACRYEKGAWSECTNGQMTRQDKLKSATTTNPTVATDTTDANADSSCEPMRKITKRCNIGGPKMTNKSNKERKHKDKGKLLTCVYKMQISLDEIRIILVYVIETESVKNSYRYGYYSENVPNWCPLDRL